MTEIYVPDWVVEVALKAWFSGEDYENADMSAFNEDMRATLTAALGAWVVPLIEADEEYDDLRDRLFLLMMADPRRDGLLKQVNEADRRRRAALTTLRQEKPE